MALCGCASIGPDALTADRFDYNGAIAASTDAQMLLNLVRMRYGETPLFLDVDTVIAQYRLQRGVNLGAEIGISGPPGDPGDSIVIPEVDASWTDTPTITYRPRTGIKFTTSLLAPLRPETVFNLMQGDWSGERLIWGIVRSINGISPFLPETGEWNPRFTEMLDALARAQEAGAVEVTVAGGEAGIPTLKVHEVGSDAATLEAISTLRRLWKLDPNVREYRLVRGAVAEAPNQIAVFTTSMLDIMRTVSELLAIPPEHVAAGRSEPTVELPAGGPNGGRPPIVVRVGRDRPGAAYVSVNKDGWWYWIDADDLQSKRSLFILNVLLQLAETDVRPAGPVVTVPAGG